MAHSFRVWTAASSPIRLRRSATQPVPSYPREEGEMKANLKPSAASSACAKVKSRTAICSEILRVSKPVEYQRCTAMVSVWMCVCVSVRVYVCTASLSCLLSVCCVCSIGGHYHDFASHRPGMRCISRTDAEMMKRCNRKAWTCRTPNRFKATL